MKRKHSGRKNQNGGQPQRLNFHPDKAETWGITLTKISTELTLERCESFVDFANKTEAELDCPVVFLTPEPTNAQVAAAVQLYRERLAAEATPRTPLKESEVQKYEQTAQGLFLREHEIWKNDRKEFNEKCLTIVEIFRKYLGQSITTLSLTDLLREQKFRRVWKQINEQYGVQSRNPAQTVALRKSLDSIKLNGQQKLSGVIDQLDSVFVMLASAGSEVVRRRNIYINH